MKTKSGSQQLLAFLAEEAEKARQYNLLFMIEDEEDYDANDYTQIKKSPDKDGFELCWEGDGVTA